MDLGLTGKVAIVTGGSKGIGKAIARELAGEGVDVAICARDRRVLEEAAKTLAAATRRRIVPIVCDTTSTKSVQALVEATVAQFGRVDILVNKRIVNISPRRRRSPPGWPAAPDVICHSQTPLLQEPPRQPMSQPRALPSRRKEKYRSSSPPPVIRTGPGSSRASDVPGEISRGCPWWPVRRLPASISSCSGRLLLGYPGWPSSQIPTTRPSRRKWTRSKLPPARLASKSTSWP